MGDILEKKERSDGGVRERLRGEKGMPVLGRRGRRERMGGGKERERERERMSGGEDILGEEERVS